MAKTLLVTGSSGLIGSEVCVYFASLGYTVHGVDNNQRAVFFGPQGDTRWNQSRLAQELKGFVHHELDIRDRHGHGVLEGAVGQAPQETIQRAAAIRSRTIVSADSGMSSNASASVPRGGEPFAKRISE